MIYYVVINEVGAYFNPNLGLFQAFSSACTMSYDVASRYAALTRCVMRKYNKELDR